MITTVTLNASVDKLYLVDRLEPQQVMRVKEVHNSAGGKGLNVARVAALLGEPVTATGFVGGHAGDYIREMLQQDGVRHDFVGVPGETRSCVNVRDLSTGRHTELLEPGLPVPEDCFAAFLSKYDGLLKTSAAVAVSGSVPAGTPQDFYGLLVRHAHEAGVPVILDTSGSLLAQAAASRPTLMKPNRDEAAQLLGRRPEGLEQLKEAAAQLHREGVPVAVISLGGDGALLCADAGLYRGYTPDIPVLNTVGCGDSMVAAFAVGLARGMSAPEMLKLALAVSTANALSLRTGWFEQADLERLRGQVRVEKLD